MAELDLDAAKRAAAERALEYVRDGMVLGLGTGSTAAFLIRALGEQVRAGLTIRAVPTSTATAELARAQGIALVQGDGPWSIDVAIDGADQVDPQLDLIKGGGGALLREKIVAAAARQFVVIVDQGKLVPSLSGPVPVEVVPFGWRDTAQRIVEQLGGLITLREQRGAAFVTDGGHHILDLHSPDGIADPADLERRLNAIPGVVDNGLFVGRTSVLIVGEPAGVRVQTRT